MDLHGAETLALALCCTAVPVGCCVRIFCCCCAYESSALPDVSPREGKLASRPTTNASRAPDVLNRLGPVRAVGSARAWWACSTLRRVITCADWSQCVCAACAGDQHITCSRIFEDHSGGEERHPITCFHRSPEVPVEARRLLQHQSSTVR